MTIKRGDVYVVAVAAIRGNGNDTVRQLL